MLFAATIEGLPTGFCRAGHKSHEGSYGGAVDCGRDTVSDFWTAANDANKMDHWRNQLSDRLAKTGQVIGCLRRNAPCEQRRSASFPGSRCHP